MSYTPARNAKESKAAPYCFFEKKPKRCSRASAPIVDDACFSSCTTAEHADTTELEEALTKAVHDDDDEAAPRRPPHSEFA